MARMEKSKRMEKSIAGALLGKVPEDKRFWCHTGQVIQDLGELHAALAGISEESYRYHVNGSKNDFSAWVRLVVKDENLARDLEKSTTPGQAAKKVADRVSFLRRAAA